MLEFKSMYQGDHKKIVELIPNGDGNNRVSKLIVPSWTKRKLN